MFENYPGIYFITVLTNLVYPAFTHNSVKQVYRLLLFLKIINDLVAKLNISL